MQVTYNWLKDFVEINIAPEELAEKLTMAGLEVTSLKPAGEDWVFEIEVTSNRPDWLSVVGIAREVSAITGKKLAQRKFKPVVYTRKQSGELSIDVQDKKDCPLYTAKIIRGIRVSFAPDWLRQRLELVGCRSINSIVDITNYVLFEYGEPLHAFDLGRLEGKNIIVRRAKDGEKIITIDGQSQVLGPNILVIADKNRVVAVAGIMGGQDTEVSYSTKDILLEAAVFDPLIIRRARQKLGMQSESAYRFERGINPQIVEEASQRARELIEEIGGGKCVIAQGQGILKAKKLNISLELKRVEKILGKSISLGRIKGILGYLGFKVAPKRKNILGVSIPVHRQDVAREEDLIEEIARILGYDEIPTTLPAIKPQITIDKTRSLITLVKNILVGLGLNEVVTYSLISRELSAKLNPGKEGEIEILNPLSKEQEVLRTALASGLLDCVSRNLNHKQDYINIFEVAKVFAKNNNHSKEGFNLAIALCGIKPRLFKQGLVKDEVGILHLKGLVETVLSRVGIKHYCFKQEDNAESVGVYINKERIGLLLEVGRGNLEKFEIKNRKVVVAELSLERLLAEAGTQKKFVPLPLYPGITRDISLLINEKTVIEEMILAVQEKGKPWLREVRVTDYYRGKQIPLGFKGLTISCFYRSDERTLTETEIHPLHAALVAVLEERFGVKIR